MDHKQIRELLAQVADGALGVGEALDRMSWQPVADMAEGVTLDTHRACRTGLGEVVFGVGKSARQLVDCVRGLAQAGQPVLATRVDAVGAEALGEAFPEGAYHERGSLFVLGADLGLAEPWPAQGEVLVVTAGSSDMGVALEAYGTARFLGLDCGLVGDVGVAGVHRLGRHAAALRAARMLIVVAGMDGALPSVLAGLVPAPVVAVPSSQGGGNVMGGVASMLAMLNSCSPGITVCNVDNGFGAAAFAAKTLAAMRGEA